MAARRQVFEIPGIAHEAPIPMAAKVGNTLYSSGIMGRDPATGRVVPEPERQAELIFRHIRTLMQLAGGTTDDIVHMTVLVKDLTYRDHVNREWLKMFPDEHNRPARHTVVQDLRGGMLIQCELVAVID